MQTVRVVVTDYIEQDLNWEEQVFQELGVEFSQHQLKFANLDELVEATRLADVIIVNMAPFDEALISRLERCRMIIRYGIPVVNIPDYCVAEVAEQALMLIMACQRKLKQQLHSMHLSAQAGKWIFDPVYPVYQMQGKTVGIVGLGRIGGTLYRMLSGFGVKFLVHDPYLSDKRKAEYGVSTCSLEQLLRESDIVTIHCPLKWDETYHMFDAPQFQTMKETAILVNTARGAIVNLDALDAALTAGDIAQAGIDVYEVEPPPADLPILHNQRAVCTPHLSWLSEESGWTIREKIVDEVRRFLDGVPPLNPLNPEVLDRKAETP
jgi:D-3-phosphoglycerate dehydrogenase / 2-oxoglutarate reductase